MQPRGSSGHASRRTLGRIGGLLAPVLLIALVAGCAHAGSPPQSPAASPATGVKVTPCGTGKTAADVPVRIEVARGNVSCATAMKIENAYAQAIRSGLAPGNGGGGPLTVRGWTCQGFATPVVLKTGQTSKCVRDGNEILAILPPPA